ncbi:hypothetical protein [Streptosporangium sp. NPDC049644]|uniref:hypothetical protein n=1 Tax=Streptosporangium sp. NPDC049644 TaxID=3155507 RepID=UPI003426E1B5
MPREPVERHVGAGADAAHAFDIGCAHHRQVLLSAGDHFAERASDLDDTADRASRPSAAFRRRASLLRTATSS